jgi:zinc transport system substrate-binding protein
MLQNNITWSVPVRRFAYVISTLMMGSSLAMADVKVMASIKPIHSLVASVMEGVGAPALIVDGANSPHTFNMKPSDAAALEQAQVIFWVGHQLEAFLEKPLDALAGKATTVALIDTKNVAKLPMREAEHEESGEHHHHGDADMHIWLDPENAKAIVSEVAETLSRVDAENATTYKTNAEKTLQKLDTLSAELTTSLAPAKGKDFIVFHDAYQYFENRFGLNASSAISINPENPPGAKQIAALQKRIADGKIKCVFAEPQFNNKIVSVILEGTTAKAATLDPVGASLDAGPELYEQLMRGLAQNLTTCLAN